MVEATLWIAALYVDTEGPAVAVDTALVSVTGSAAFVFTNENGVVILSAIEFFAALIEQPLPNKCADHIPIQKTVLE